MSILSSFLIFLLCLCMQACNARHLMSAFITSSALQSHFSSKVAKNVTFSADSEVQRGGAEKSGSISAILEDAKEVKAATSKVLKYATGVTGAVIPLKHPIKGFSRNNKEDNSGLFSDYSRPHTRPPSHN